MSADFRGEQNNFGVSPLSPTTNASILTVTGLTRGSGIGTNGTAAARGWGGNSFTAATEATAVTANQFHHLWRNGQQRLQRLLHFHQRIRLSSLIHRPYQRRIAVSDRVGSVHRHNSNILPNKHKRRSFVESDQSVRRCPFAKCRCRNQRDFPHRQFRRRLGRHLVYLRRGQQHRS